jgi:proline racemase
VNSKTKSSFTGKALREDNYKGKGCLIVEVGGHGYYTGESKYWLEEDDNIGKGFII